MRERTPSADDTPKRAPPAPLREASSADVVGGRRARVEASPIARFSSPTANKIMVVSHNLGELVLPQRCSNTSDRQYQDKHHYYNHQNVVCRSGQSAQDKRSRLSNVINNLKKKVPESGCESCDTDGRNSVERNLETLEKYVMTVLNGVIKDAETEGRGVSGINGIGDSEDTSRFSGSNSKEDARIIAEDGRDPVVNREPSEPSAVEPAVPDADKIVDKREMEDKETNQRSEDESLKMANDTRNCSAEIIVKTKETNALNATSSVSQARKSSLDQQLDADVAILDVALNDKIENSNTDQSESSVERVERSFASSEDIRIICRDILNDLLNDISQMFENEESIDPPTTSFHCSLPLDKVAPALQTYESIEAPTTTSQVSPKSSPKSSPSSTVRHLCLYCDRKFLSISLRQRHIERVHQHNSGRRSSERNARKTTLNCLYCSNKYIDGLESFFQHMVACHADKYHFCLQCNIRYGGKEGLAAHIRDTHTSNERISEVLDRSKDTSPLKELHSGVREVTSIQGTRDLPQEKSEADKRDHENHRLDPPSTLPTSTKLNMFQRLSSNKDFSNPASPDFDSSFYSSVSCNIRENLLHHLDGKLQNNANNYSLVSHDIKQPQQHYQSFHEPGSQIQFPIDISLTAATPVDSKEYSSSDKCENSSKYAQKPGKTSRTHPRRVSFEKYNFPRKYDGKEQWTCSIKDLSKFDIYTQLTLKKKQELLKEKNQLIPETMVNLSNSDIGQTSLNDSSEDAITPLSNVENISETQVNQETMSCVEDDDSQDTQFSLEFGNFMKLRRWDECPPETVKSKEIVYAELTGEWSRPRVYICGACSSRYLTLKEMEDHKVTSHPNVWCSHLEFSGDQRELYKHLFLPGKSSPAMKIENNILPDKICTKCSKACNTLAELHRHMLECGGDQAWLLGLFGNGKKKCKWRPFGSRSRRRRQRGMKRNIQNSQTPRVNQPKEKQPSGPRVRPSDFESIQKMLANLPAKRSTRRDIQETQSRLRKGTNQSRHSGENIASNTRLSSKAVLRNKLIKNAKSFQRKRCRGDNISAAIESVINNYKSSNRGNHLESKKKDEEGTNGGSNMSKELKETNKLESSKFKSKSAEVAKNVQSNNRSNKIVKSVGIVSKRKKLKMEEKRKLKSANKISSTKQVSTSTEKKESTKSTKSLAKKSTKDELNQENQRKVYKSVSDNVLSRKRKSDPQSSLNASIKAKTQLRTHDGKFARNPERSASSQCESLGSSSQLTRTRTTRSDPGPLVTRSRLRMVVRKESNIGLKKRITRMSSDSDKMPTLEPVDGLMACQEETKKSSNNLPILSPVTPTTSRSNIRVISSKLNGTNKKKIRGRKRRKNVLNNKLNKAEVNNEKESTGIEQEENASLKQGRDLRVRKRKSFSPKIPNSLDKDEPLKRQGSLRELKSSEDDSDVGKKNSKPQVVTSVKKDEPYKVLESRKARQERRTGSLEELSHLQEVPLEVKKLLGPKDDLFTQIGIAKSPKIRRNLRQFKQTTKNKITFTRRSKIISKNKDQNSSTDTADEKLEKSQSKKLNKSTDRNENSNESIDQVDSSPKINTSEKQIIDSEKLLTKNSKNTGRNLRSKKSIVELDSPPIKVLESESIKSVAITSVDNCDKGVEKEEEGEEHNADDSKSEECQKIVTADLVSLSFEHLQQESSNSNIDSGKENLSETPVNISKAKISRPKKCRGFRRDRVVKRTLNNVIGILTEGVNIPVEVQQNVVLTVQTSIDNMNANSGIQNSRVELDDNGVSPNTVSSVIINENVDENHRIINECVSNDNDNKESNNEEIQCTNNSNEIESNNTLLKSKSESNLKTENNVSDSSIVKDDIEEPNDIILDLSRRKTKGKGSFLEKIVSKIAKQKDALLEGEVGSLLDNAVDELSIILDEVGPALGESNESAKNLQRNEIDETDKSLILSKENNEDLKEIKDSLVTENNVKKDSCVDVAVSDNINSSNENTCKTLENVNEISQRTSKKRSLEVEETTNKRKSVVEPIENEADKIEDDLCLDDIIELINSPKRESLAINEDEQEKVRPGKRKNVDRQQGKDNDDEGNDTNVWSSENCGKLQIDVIKPNKKSKQCRDDKMDNKIADSSIESNQNYNSPVGNDSNINTNQISQDEVNNQSREARESEEMKKLECFNDQAIELTDLNQDETDNQSMSSELNPSSNKVAVVEANLATMETKEIIKSDCSPEKSTDGKKKKVSDENKLEIKEEKSTKLRKRNYKKKSVADKHLELKEDEVVKKVDIHSFEHAESDGNIDDVRSLDQINSEEKLNSNNISLESSTINVEKLKNLKTPEITETPQNTKTRASKKKSLANEHLELPGDIVTQNPKEKLKDTLEDIADIKSSSNLINETKESSFGDIRPKGLKSKKKKDDDDCFQVNLPKENKKTVEDENNTSNDTLIERRKTLKRKAKENIFLIEALLDFYYDTDSLSEPESAKTSNEALEPVGDSQKASNKTEKVISKENIQTQLEEIENKNKDEEIATKLTSPTVETPALEPENAVDDDSNVKKRASGNFAVVHTKSGEILIVEKKKKFTKEAAKFFCNVCTTSFTRKSSLKKHNQSQSHLLQVTKVGADQENQEELLSFDDATMSSIDRSEITVNEDHLETTTTTTDIMKEKKEQENNVKAKQSDEKNAENNEKLPEVKDDMTEGIETKSTLNNQMGTDLEDELLDEEISKITEHMTHDEYVLTDHISPMPEGTSTPVKEANESLAELSNVSENEQKLQNQKINLADEHLNLDSPILTDKLEHRDDHLNKFTPENSLFTPENDLNDLEDNKNTEKFVSSLEENNSVELKKISDLKQTLDESKVSLDFTNITEKLKNNEFIKNNSKSLDENNLDVNLKNDLEIKNNSELDEQVKNIRDLPSICDNSLSKEKSTDIDTISLKRKKERSVDSEHFDSMKKCNRSSVQGDTIKKDNGSELNRKLSKSVEKIKRAKSKNKNSIDKAPVKKLIEDSSDSEYDEKNTSEAQSKGKIVKSVFGRALTGEKVDKVKEVLDDWVSRFDSDSQENSRGNNWRNRKDEKKNKHEKSLSNTKPKATLKKNNFNLDQSSTGDTNELSINSRCRQSKKRAEERISRAFEEESIPYELAYEIRKQSNSIKNIINYESLIQKGNQDKLETDSIKSSDSKKSKIKENELINEINENVDEKDEDMDQFNSNYTNLKSKTDEFLFPDTNSMESIHTRVPSCPRERSSTPDLVSLTTRDSENDAEIGTDVEDDNEDIIRGRLSPSYVSNLPESSIDSASNSEDKGNKNESVTINRRSSSEFSGERIFIRSTVSSQESRSEVVTIAPTDAIEDNALDVPQEAEESLQKSRSGKVLNFDEELFVECCSRLKATTENELRGTKKIKLDHLEHYDSKVDQNIPRTNRGRWKDTDNQNSLGSLLESVNQLLGEEMYSRNRANEYHKRSQSFRSETPSPVAEEQSDFIQTEHPAYEDSLDVAFEHNNKLRDKIQQRMRESENLIATSFSHKSNSFSNSNDDSHHRHHHNHRHHHHHHHHHHRQQNHSRHHDNSHHQRRHHEKNFDDYNKNNDSLDNPHNIGTKHLSLESVGLKNKIDSNLDGLLDKALSNILHNNGKHDHNASTPMNVLAELACAQVPTSTISEVKFTREKIPKTKTLSNGNDWLVSPQSTDKIERDQLKKPRNPIKELFERKNELNDRKQHENSCITSSEKESIGFKQKMKKVKRQDDFPLIRKGPFKGMSERKKRRNDKKREIPNKIKDVYEFDDEESGESRFGTTLSYRSKNEKNIVGKTITSKEINVAELVSRTITKTLENDKAVDPLGKRLENMIECKFQEIESSIPKTKGALKAYHVEEKQQQSITGPMDNFVERKWSRRLSMEHLNKHNKTKKKTKNSKKRSRNAWYENDSSDEFVTAIKKENIGVGISKSQRTCSKGKQNLFAELSTSSESEYDDKKVIHQSNRIVNSKESIDMNSDIEENYELQLDDGKINDWIDINCKNDFENKKSESDLSDQPLIIDEKKESDEQDNSDNDTDNRSEHVFELDDLYREDSSVIGSDCEENSIISRLDKTDDTQKDDNIEKHDLIPLEKALDLLESSENFEEIPTSTKTSIQTHSRDIFERNDKIKSHEDNDFDEMLETKDSFKTIADELNELTELPEKLTTNEKPDEKASDNLPLHVFLSRKVQESKKRKEEQLKKQQEEERVAMEFQSTRRQRKCAIGKQGLLAEISSSDEEYYFKNTMRRSVDKSDYDKSKRQKRESKEKKKERYMEKKHEQIIAKEQKAIEEEILRELELKKEINAQDDKDIRKNSKSEKKKIKNDENDEEMDNKKYQRFKKNSDEFLNVNRVKKDDKFISDIENKTDTTSTENEIEKKSERKTSISSKKEHSTSSKNSKKTVKSNKKSTGAHKKSKNAHDYSRSNSTDDEELRTTKSWNKVEEGVGVAIGRRKRAAANQLYYWSSSSDDDEEFIQPSPEVEDEDDRQEQHGWIVGDSHKKMITMLAMEKQLKEKRRRSEEEFGNIKTKSKKHRNSTS